MSSQSQPARFAKTQAELSRLCDVSRQRINWNLKVEGNPGRRADGRYEVAAWQEWFLSRESLAKDDPTLADLKAKNLSLRNDRIAARIETLRRQFVPFEDVEKWADELKAHVRRVVFPLRSLAPLLVTMSVADAELCLKEEENRILTELHTAGGDMDNKPQDVVSV